MHDEHFEGEHTHPHTHADGVTHTHAHTHDHEHEHEHSHCHADCSKTSCESCAQAALTPRQELMGLMKYMVGHNQSHANELAAMAQKLKDMGEDVAYEQILLAVSDFEKGNLRLSTVLAAMNG